MASSILTRAHALALTLALAACGGTVVFEEDGGGGASSSSPSNAAVTGSGSGTNGSSGPGSPFTSSQAGPDSSAEAAVSSSTYGLFCGDHTDCGGGACQWSSGFCLAACGEDGTCGPGAICDDCATSSCPKCADCISGCIPAEPPQCDDHDDCHSSAICVYGTGTCQQRCAEGQECPAGQFCQDCATSSCPGCRDCQPACVSDDGPAPPPGG